MNTFKLFTKPFEVAKQAILVDKTFSEYFKILIQRIKEEYSKQIHGVKHLRQTNYVLGLKHYSIGNYYDARMRFNMLNLFGSSTPELNYFIGRCYYEEGDAKNAIKCMNLYIESNDEAFREEASYTLNILNDKPEEITRIPMTIVEHFYDLVCPVYEELYIDNSNNEGTHQKLFSLTHRALTEKARPFGNKILDIGCGTGAMGKFARQQRIASYLVGVDASQNMIDVCSSLKTEQFPVYNETFKKSVNEFFAEFDAQHKFDLYFANNIFLSYSEVQETLEKAFDTSEKNAIFSFSVKTHNGPESFIFSPALEEFKYNKDYILSLAAPNWKVIHSESTSFIDEDEGMLIILQKNNIN